MFIISICDMSFLMTQIWLVIIRCGSLCPYGYTYGSKFFEVYIYLFVGYVIITLAVMVDICVSIERLRSFDVKSKTKNGNANYTRQFLLTCLGLLIISIGLNIPLYAASRNVVPLGYLITSDVPKLNDTIIEKMNMTQLISIDPDIRYEILFQKEIEPSWFVPSLQVLITVFTMIKGPVFFFVLAVVNVMVSIRFKAYRKKKKKITGGNQSMASTVTGTVGLPPITVGK
jgi:hypothetical protein